MAATSLTTRKALSPLQIPTSPQSNTRAAHTNGRNPPKAARSVALRMKAASPAPNITPSNANTTPQTGWSATKNHHALGTSSSTAVSDVNTCGRTPANKANTTPRAVPKTRPYLVTCHATERARSTSEAPSASPTRACAAMASESSTIARKFHSCNTTWWAPTVAVDVCAATVVAEM